MQDMHVSFPMYVQISTLPDRTTYTILHPTFHVAPRALSVLTCGTLQYPMTVQDKLGPRQVANSVGVIR